MWEVKAQGWAIKGPGGKSGLVSEGIVEKTKLPPLLGSLFDCRRMLPPGSLIFQKGYLVFLWAPSKPCACPLLYTC